LLGGGHVPLGAAASRLLGGGHVLPVATPVLAHYWF